MAFHILKSAEATWAIRELSAKRTGVQRTGRLGCLRHDFDLLTTMVKDRQDKRDKDKEAVQVEKRRGMWGKCDVVSLHASRQASLRGEITCVSGKAESRLSKCHNTPWLLEAPIVSSSHRRDMPMALQSSTHPYTITCVQKVGTPFSLFVIFVPSSMQGRSYKQSRNTHHALSLSYGNALSVPIPLLVTWASPA